MAWDKTEYIPLLAYAQSKTANIYMANSIERHYGSKGLHATSVHPGGIFGTQLIRYRDAERERAQMQDILPYYKSMEQGAATQVWAAVAKHWNGKGGRYLADLGEAEPWQDHFWLGANGYAPHAYNEEAEERLWKISCDAIRTTTGA